ncbi:MAG TPA: hypothetical protein VF412_12150 [Bdellovibrio sp.]|uniref:hypothetical protein n=1 Tax=Bdellovibrio sp. TaxID=28201 RepID=UPI002EF46FF4
MRKILGLIFVSAALILTSCTSNEGAVKKLAAAQAESKYDEMLKKEAEDMIPQSDFLRQGYVDYLKKHSEFETEDVKIEGENFAIAKVTVTTYPAAMRKTLAKIAGTVDPSKARQFNFGNALQLIAQQTGGSTSTAKQDAGVFKYHKNSSGNWLLEE